MPLRDRPLTASSLTFGQAPFEERVQAAASAGFTGIGLSAEVYLAAHRDGLDDSAMHAVLDGHGISVTEVEFLTDWMLVDGAPAAERTKESTLLHIARTFGADRIHVGLFEEHPLELMSRDFAALCARAGDVQVAVEFMPFGGIPDLRTAWEMVRCAERPNAGLLLDVWHWVRAETTPHDLDPVSPDQVFALQLCDVARDRLSDMRYESLHHRLVPGDGDGHAADLLTLLASRGVDAELCVEVMSDELARSGTAATAESVIVGARSVLSEIEKRHEQPLGGKQTIR